MIELKSSGATRELDAPPDRHPGHVKAIGLVGHEDVVARGSEVPQRAEEEEHPQPLGGTQGVAGLRKPGPLWIEAQGHRRTDSEQNRGPSSSACPIICLKLLRKCWAS